MATSRHPCKNTESRGTAVTKNYRGEAADEPPRRGRAWLRKETRYLLEVAALVAFALTQPILNVFGRAPDVFVFEGANRRDVLPFAFLFSMVPVLVIWGIDVTPRFATIRGLAAA